MGLTLDYTKPEVKDSLKGMQPLPKGAYPGIMESFQEGVAQSSGNPKVTVHYKIAPDAPDGAGRTIIKDYALTPKALWRWTQDMIALGGVEGDYFDGNAKVDVVKVCTANLNRRGILVLSDPDEGFTFNKLDKVRPSR